MITRDNNKLYHYFQCCKCLRYYCTEWRRDYTLVTRRMTKEEELGYRLRGETSRGAYCKTCGRD
jgi:hypothetical protein